jgi:predicted RNA-binding protein associated with RNAse of E/G family
MARVIEEEGTRFTDPESLEARVSEYAQVKGTIEVMEARSKELREKLFDTIETQGFEDDKGNIVLEFEAPIAGIARLEKQRRVTRKLDESIAEGIITQAGLADDVYKTIRVIDEDALMAAHYEGKLTEEEIDQMFPSKVVWALMAPKKK